MRKALWIGLLVVLLLGVYAVAPQAAKAGGPCDGPYGGYAGCSMAGSYGGYMSSGYGGYMSSGYGGYSSGGMASYMYGGYVYNRVCYWYGWGWYRSFICTYVRVPAYPASGIYYGYNPCYWCYAHGMPAYYDP